MASNIPSQGSAGPKGRYQVQKDAVGVLCPKCHEMNIVSEAARGKPHKCKKCIAVFMIPTKAGARPAAKPPAARPGKPQK